MKPSIFRRNGKARFTLDNLRNVTSYQDNSDTFILSPTHKKRSRPATQLDLDGNPIAIFKSCTNAAKNFTLSKISNVHQACTGKSKTAYGFRWRFSTEDDLKNFNF